MFKEDGEYSFGRFIHTHDLSEQEMQDRLQKIPVFESSIKSGWLARYVQHVTSANTGAVMKA